MMKQKLNTSAGIRIALAKIILGQAEKEAVERVLSSGVLSRGPLRETFEERFSRYISSRHAIIVSSGTAALHLAIKSLDLKPGTEVILPSLTFVATALAVEYCGLVPVFAEIDPTTFTLQPEDVERRITPRTRAILPVHYAGQPADMDAIMGISEKHGLYVVVDAAHAIGARHGDKMVGCQGNLTAFSLFATKNMTSGEGGVVTTDDGELAARIRRMRGHGILPHEEWKGIPGAYDVVEEGYNYHLSDVNIAIALEQLEALNAMNQARKERAQLLSMGLSEIEGIQLPKTVRDHVYHLYTIRVSNGSEKERGMLLKWLLRNGIQAGIYYPPVHLFTHFRHRYGMGPGLLPITEEISSSILSLPMHPWLSEREIDAIVEGMRKGLEELNKEG